MLFDIVGGSGCLIGGLLMNVGISVMSKFIPITKGGYEGNPLVDMFINVAVIASVEKSDHGIAIIGLMNGEFIYCHQTYDMVVSQIRKVTEIK